jgi:outer membrane receptor protein involved in Fe transport
VKQRIDLVALLLVVGLSSLARAQQAAPSKPDDAAEGAPDQESGEAAEPEAEAPAEPAAPAEAAAPEAAEPAAEPAPEAAPPPTPTGNAQEIVVTGSRIKRSSAFAASAPVEVIDRKQLEYSGATTLADVVQYLTVSQGAGFQGGAGGPGTTSINLRGLGLGATLILLNGRRLPPSGANAGINFTDISTIPLAAVDHIEILKGGASAIYGSDAVGGVVNIITRRALDGARVELDGQATQNFDYRSGTVSGVLGATSDRGRVMVSMQYGQNTELDANERSWTNRSTSLYLISGQPATYFKGAMQNADPACAQGPQSKLMITRDAMGAPTGSQCSFNLRNYTFLLPRGERANAFGSAEYDLTNHLTLYSELLVSRLAGDGRGQPSFLVLPPLPTVPANHVDNPFGSDVLFLGLPFGANEGPVRNRTTDDTLRGLIGVKGDFEDAGRDTIFESWEWDLHASFGQSRYYNLIYDNLRKQFQDALNSCGDPANLKDCFNPFYSSVLGTGTPNSDTVKQRIKGEFANLSSHALATYNAGMSGNLFELPGGDAGIAFGTEIRHEWRTSETDHDANTYNYGAVIGNTDAFAARNVYSGYVELRLPFYNGIELQGAGRIERYTDVNQTASSPSVGLTISPAEIGGRDNAPSSLRRLQIRGHATSSFRAPSLYQSFPGALVLAAPFTDPMQAGVQFIGVKIPGSQTLKPEHAVAFSGGLFWQPVDEITLSGEFWYYDYKDRIATENAVDIVNQWIVRRDSRPAGAPLPTDPHIVASPMGGLQQVITPYVNVPGSLVTNGIDFIGMINLTGATFGGNKDDFGNIGFGALGTYTLTYDVPYGGVLKDLTKDGLKCDGTALDSPCHVAGFRNSYSATIPPVPRWKINFPVTWVYSGHNVAVITHFVSSVLDDQFGANNAGKSVVLPVVSSWTTIDAQYGYTLKDFIGKELTFRVGVYNLLNSAPPNAVGSALNLAGFDPELHDPRGRMLYAKLISQF